MAGGLVGVVFYFIFLRKWRFGFFFMLCVLCFFSFLGCVGICWVEEIWRWWGLEVFRDDCVRGFALVWFGFGIFYFELDFFLSFGVFEFFSCSFGFFCLLWFCFFWGFFGICIDFEYLEYWCFFWKVVRFFGLRRVGVSVFFLGYLWGVCVYLYREGLFWE